MKLSKIEYRESETIRVGRSRCWDSGASTKTQTCVDEHKPSMACNSRIGTGQFPDSLLRSATMAPQLQQHCLQGSSMSQTEPAQLRSLNMWAWRGKRSQEKALLDHGAGMRVKNEVACLQIQPEARAGPVLRHTLHPQEHRFQKGNHEAKPGDLEWSTSLARRDLNPRREK